MHFSTVSVLLSQLPMMHWSLVVVPFCKGRFHHGREGGTQKQGVGGLAIFLVFSAYKIRAGQPVNDANFWPYLIFSWGHI